MVLFQQVGTFVAVIPEDYGRLYQLFSPSISSNGLLAHLLYPFDVTGIPPEPTPCRDPSAQAFLAS